MPFGLVGAPVEDDEEDQRSKLRKLLDIMDQKGMDTTAFEEHVRNMPQRQPLSTGKKVISSLAGAFLGPERTLSLLDQPYEREVSDWKAKGAGLAQLAAGESHDKASKLKMLMDTEELIGKNTRSANSIAERANYHGGVIKERETAHAGALAEAARGHDIQDTHNAVMEEIGRGRLADSQTRTGIIGKFAEARGVSAKAYADRVANQIKTSGAVKPGQIPLIVHNNIQKYIATNKGASKLFTQTSGGLMVPNYEELDKLPETQRTAVIQSIYGGKTPQLKKDLQDMPELNSDENDDYEDPEDVQ